VEIGNQIKPYLDNIASYFKKIKGSAVGVDVGSDSLKIVKLKKVGKKLKLENYALIKIQKGLTRQEVRKISGELIKEALDEMSMHEKKINIGIPSYSSLITLMEVSGQTEKEIESEIEYEAAKYIPVDLSEVVFDWQIIETSSMESPSSQELSGSNKDVDSGLNQLEKNKNQFQEESRVESAQKNSSDLMEETGLNNKKVLLVSTMKNISNEYQKSLDDNNLEINSIEVDCFSTQRSLLKKQNGSYLIIDIGGKVTNIIGIYKGQLLFNRNIDSAGNKLTELIAKNLNINQERAEKMKLKQGMKSDSDSVNKNIMEPFFDSIIEQAQKSMDKVGEFKNIKLDKVVLSGGVSETVGLKEYIQKKMNGVEVVYGNPWAGIEYPVEIKDKLLAVAPFFGVAVGLAMIDLE
jgi:type IV pilus assembly protein PilM